MPKASRKKGGPLATPEDTSPIVSSPDFSDILGSGLDLSAKRAAILKSLGIVSVKKKYATVAERKAAAKARAKTKRQKKAEVLSGYGVGPKKREPARPKAERTELRKKRSKDKRQFLKEMAKQNPELAKKYGIDTSAFRK